MNRFAAAIAAFLLLAGCGEDDGRQAPGPAEPRPAASQAGAEPTVAGKPVAIVALGDSLFTGYGLKDGEDYPSRLEASLRARGVNARIANAGVSGDTTAAGLQRLAFTLDGQTAPPKLVIISLGGNDMLRSLPPEEARANLDRMLTELKAREIPVVMLGMLAAPNLGKDYARKFNAIYPELAKKHGATLVPFFLQPLMNRPDLIQSDRVHPTAAGLDALAGATVEVVAGAIRDATETDA